MKRQTSAILIAVLMTVSSSPNDASTPNKAWHLDLAYSVFLRTQQQAVVKEFNALLAIPNAAGDLAALEQNARVIERLLQRREFATQIWRDHSRPPVVFGERKTRRPARTLLLYAHYDGQPVDVRQWHSDPWKPMLLDAPREEGGREIPISGPWPAGQTGEWRLYGRSTADDKAPIAALLAALDFIESRRLQLSVNLKLIIEGEEEAGSPHLPAILEAHKEQLAADGMLLCDGPVHQSRRPQLLFGARGMAEVEMTVYGPNRPLHSGHYGNWAPNPAALLAGLLSRMRDAEGKILIPGFYDDVRPLSATERQTLADIPSADVELRREYGLAWSEAENAPLNERILLPALNVRGLEAGHTGSLAENAVPAEARASIDFRLVPEQTPEGVRRQVEDFISGQGFHVVHDPPDEPTRLAYPRLIRMQWGPGYLPARTDMEISFSRAVSGTLENGMNVKMVRQPSVGGSIPMRLFSDTLNVPVICLPIANHDNRQHGPDENLRLQNLWEGIRMFAILLTDLGKQWR